MHPFSYVAMRSCTVYAHRTKRTLGHSACDLSLVTEEGYKPLKCLCVHEQALLAPANTILHQSLSHKMMLTLSFFSSSFFCCPLLLFVVRVGVGGCV